MSLNIGALIIRIGFGGRLSDNYALNLHRSESRWQFGKLF